MVVIWLEISISYLQISDFTFKENNGFTNGDFFYRLEISLRNEDQYGNQIGVGGGRYSRKVEPEKKCAGAGGRRHCVMSRQRALHLESEERRMSSVSKGQVGLISQSGMLFR